ncbi:hypothetical protein Mgra_00003521 [Meloidogyne graminicola]|uniref:Uncharacterized protein n=1 Tax=Meloidogyne graminicola TaxID=189291 RepID=A0A8S9ZVF7_9BILA|nr:hypothetical protein Mgra_00003521 [Meloidogyne graminicola]
MSCQVYESDEVIMWRDGRALSFEEDLFTQFINIYRIACDYTYVTPERFFMFPFDKPRKSYASIFSLK